MGMVAASFLASESTFEALFEREYPVVVAVAYRVLGERGEAEDVAQEVFARAVARHGSRFPAPGALRLAAAHRALNVLRSRRRRIAREVADFQRNRSGRDAAERGADPGEILDRGQRALLVRAALARLRPRDAELLAMRYAGASYREVAESLRIDAAHVGTRLARAEQAFKREIERAGFF